MSLEATGTGSQSTSGKTEPKKSWVAEPSRADELPALGRFFKRVYTGRGTHGTMEQFQWKILENPTCQGVINVVRTPTGIGATTSLVPKTAFVQGQPQKLGEIGDCYTDERYYRQGMFALLVNRSREDGNRFGIELVYGTPNQQALPGHEKYCNLKRLPQMQVRSLSYVLHPGAVLKNRWPWFLANAVDFLYSTWAGLKIWWRQRLTSASGLNCEEISTTPQEWDAFVRDASAPYDFIFSRETRQFRWRYFENPAKYHVWTLRKDSRLLATLTYRLILDEDVTSLVIGDYLTLPGEEESLRPLIQKALSAGLRGGCLKATVWVPKENPFYSIFRQYGFGGETEIPVILHHSERALELIRDCRRWFFTVGDSDNV